MKNSRRRIILQCIDKKVAQRGPCCYLGSNRPSATPNAIDTYISDNTNNDFKNNSIDELINKRLVLNKKSKPANKATKTEIDKNEKIHVNLTISINPIKNNLQLVKSKTLI